MSEHTTSRRNFITAALSGGAAALAGCSAQGSNPEENQSTSTKTVKTEGKDQTVETQNAEISEEDEIDQAEFEESLKALAYDLDEDLAYEGFDPDFQRVELRGEKGDNVERDDGEYDLGITLDSDSLLHGSGLLVGDQDFYTAAEVGAMYDIFEDGQRELNEATDIISERLEEFSEDTEVPEDYNIEVRINFEGARGSSTGFGFEYGEETVDEATEEFLKDAKAADQKGDGHRVGYHPGEYENLALLEKGESLTFHISDGETSEEHTFEYNGGAVISVDGEKYRPREEDGMIRTQVLGEEIRVNQFNPLYLQERGEIPEAVELKFEHTSPNY